jgi:hypothetical protein
MFITSILTGHFYRFVADYRSPWKNQYLQHTECQLLNRPASGREAVRLTL